LCLDCLDAYPDCTPLLRLPASKNYSERTIPLTQDAADVIRTLRDLRRDQINRPLPGKHNERPTRRLFVRQGRVLSNAYLFDDALLTACRTAGLLDAEGKPTITAHRSHRRNPTGRTRRLAPDDHERLGTQECADGLVYAHVSDPAVLDDYRSVLGPDATIAGPSASAVHTQARPAAA
jgi:integrase